MGLGGVLSPQDLCGRGTRTMPPLKDGLHVLEMNAAPLVGPLPLCSRLDVSNRVVHLLEKLLQQ